MQLNSERWQPEFFGYLPLGDYLLASLTGIEGSGFILNKKNPCAWLLARKLPLLEMSDLSLHTCTKEQAPVSN